MVRIHVLHSEPVYAQGLVAVLSSKGIDVSTSCSALGGVSLPWQVELFIIDSLPGGNALITLVAEAAKIAPVLLIGLAAEPEVVQNWIAAGARGFIDRRSESEVIVQAIHAVIASDRFCEMAAPSGSSVPEVISASDALSTREYQVLQQIARGLTHDQIANRLRISRHTVDTYVKRIRVKLAVGNKAELTRAAVLGQLLQR